MGKSKASKKSGRFGKYGDSKRAEKLRDQKKAPGQSKDYIKLEEHFKIAPKHPGRGRG